MKILFWIISIFLILINVVLSFVFALAGALGGYGGTFGTIYNVINTMGSFSVVVGIVGFVFGILAYRKGNLKKAFLLSLAGTIYAVVLFGSAFVLDEVHTIYWDKEYEASLVETFGEDWNSPSNYSEIYDSYERILNMYYAALTNEFTVEQLSSNGELWGSEMMIPYYGNCALDSIGFAVMDMNNDGVEELIIGTANPQEATTAFIIYYDPGNPHKVFTGAEDEVYYFHNGENGLYIIEEFIEEEDSYYWVLDSATEDDLFKFSSEEMQLDAKDRLMLDMIPFANYK